MSFVGDPFEHDVFISYSHGDVDGDGVSLLKQWSAGFAEQLEEELKVDPTLGQSIRVFLDEHHRPGQGLDPQLPLTDQLKKDIGSAAILTLLMSPHYLASEWCRDERDWWFRTQRERGFSALGRAIVARIWDTADTPWPEVLTDETGQPQLGRDFFNRDQNRPHDWPQPDNNSRGQFRRALLELAGDITKHLRELRENLELQRQRELGRQRLREPEGQLLYLHGRADEAESWEHASRELEQRGYIVLPDSPDPEAADRGETRRLSDLRVQTLSGCDALLLVASNDARALTADLVVVGRQDRHEARDRSGRLLPCAVLDSGVPADQQRRVRTTARRLGIDWINASGSDWPPEIHSWLSATPP